MKIVTCTLLCMGTAVGTLMASELPLALPMPDPAAFGKPRHIDPQREAQIALNREYARTIAITQKKISENTKFLQFPELLGRQGRTIKEIATNLTVILRNLMGTKVELSESLDQKLLHKLGITQKMVLDQFSSNHGKLTEFEIRTLFDTAALRLENEIEEQTIRVLQYGLPTEPDDIELFKGDWAYFETLKNTLTVACNKYSFRSLYDILTRIKHQLQLFTSLVSLTRVSDYIVGEQLYIEDMDRKIDIPLLKDALDTLKNFENVPNTSVPTWFTQKLNDTDIAMYHFLDSLVSTLGDDVNKLFEVVVENNENVTLENKQVLFNYKAKRLRLYNQLAKLDNVPHEDFYEKLNVCTLKLAALNQAF